MSEQLAFCPTCRAPLRPEDLERIHARAAACTCPCGFGAAPDPCCPVHGTVHRAVGGIATITRAA